MGLCFSCVNQQTVGVIQRFGKFARMAESGCNCLIPCYESVDGFVSLRIQQLDVSCETKTMDNVFVNIVVSVQYAALPDKLYDAYYKLTNIPEQIKSYVFDVVRSTVPKINLDDVFTTKEEIAQSVKNELTKSMETFGYQIIQTLVTDIAPDMRVKNSMNEINAAQRMRIAAKDKAEAEKIMVVKAAEGDAEAKYLSGTGIARQRQAIINGMQESMTQFTGEFKEVTASSVMDMIIVTQYFDTLKDIGASSKSNTVFIPSDPGNVSNISSQIRSGIIQGNAVKEM
jgi:regulator of protease activity HflC (stomatin/prohibitin superfamily)